MRALSTFTLEVRRGSRAIASFCDAHECDSGCRWGSKANAALPDLGRARRRINALQDELDVLRADARRAFTSKRGHA
jgi:hypothetical protein